MKISKNRVLACCTLLLGYFSDCLASEKMLLPDTIGRHVIYFKQNSSVIDTGYVHNNKTLKSLSLILGDKSVSEKLQSIYISAASSPEGVYEHNIQLALMRARVMKSYLVYTYPYLDQRKIKIHNAGENWKGLLDAVVSDVNVPEREEVLRIIRQDINSGTKKWRLAQVADGTSWHYIEKNILRHLSSAETDITILVEKEKPQDEPASYAMPELESGQQTEIVEQVSDTLASERPSETVSSVDFEGCPLLALKTNLAAYVFGVANLAVEVPFAQKFSLDVPVYYSPYTLARNYQFRILGFEPELKYWFNRPFKGHSIGLHGVAVMYNIAFNSRDRFQNTNGDDFVYGGGISYGYTMRLKKNWHIEFTAGLGYLHLDHDVFRNVDNGALYDNRKFHYWGPTKLGINIIYLFNKR